MARVMAKEMAVLALLCASKYGHTRVVELLLDNNACIESVSTKSGMSPLCIASFSGHIETTKLLLSREANVDFTVVLEDGVKWRPLIWAVGKGDIEMVELLVSFGACVRCVDSNCNPLVLALSFEHTEIAAYLSSHGANVLNTVDT